MLVRESLSRFDLLNEEFLAENVLNEKIDINLIANKAKKIGILSAMFLKFMLLGMHSPAEDLPKKEEIAKDPIILSMADEDHLSRDEIFTGFEDLFSKYFQEKEEPRIFSAGNPGFIESINQVKPGRLDSSKIAQYDQYDDSIIAAVDSLKAQGEDADPNLIKAMMIIETGMKPRRNSLGYEGFPQTKQFVIDGINNRYGTNFTMADMYNAEESAKFIHYYLKAISKSQHVENLSDLIIAYNWGIGNLGKWKRGERELPQQSVDYIKMVDTMQNFFPDSPKT